MHNDSEQFDEEDYGPSKSAVKREHHAFRDLAKKLTELSDKELATIPLSESLLDPIIAAKKLKQSEALRRQISYIGKVFSREEDETQQAIQHAYDELINGRQQLARNFHRIEAWRDRLLTEGMDAIEIVIGEYPTADRQQLRQLILQANKEKKANKPPAAARKLFVYLREIAALQITERNSESIHNEETDENNE